MRSIRPFLAAFAAFLGGMALLPGGEPDAKAPAQEPAKGASAPAEPAKPPEPPAPAPATPADGPDSKAEGYAPVATGGDGGRVVEVTSLEDSGPGSFRAALDDVNQKGGPARIVFKVAGEIRVRTVMNLGSNGSNVTIDGSTAPAPGVTLDGRDIYKHCFDEEGYVKTAYKSGRKARKGSAARSFRGPMFTMSGVKNVVVRDLRFRDSPVHSFQIFRSERVLVDHISTTGCADGAFSVNAGCKNIALQWSLLAGNNLTFRCRGDQVSIHHNLFTENRMRHPFARVDGVRDIRNNVIQNWYLAGIQVEGGAQLNIVKNVFGPTAAKGKPSDKAVYEGSAIFAEGNVGPPDFDPNGRKTAPRPFAEPAVTTQSAEEAKALVLKCAGARPRDEIDKGFADGTRKYVHIMKEEWTLPDPWWTKEKPPPPPAYNPAEMPDAGEE